MKNLLYISCFALLSGCSSTKITSTSYAGYRMHEQIMVASVAGIGEQDNDQLMQWANVKLGDELSFLKTVSYQDALYQSKQFGLTLPEFNRYDTASFDALLNKLKLNYVLTGEVVSVKSQYDDPRSLNYKQPKAVLSFQLIDLANKTVSWRCTVTFTANPIGLGNDPASKINVRNADDAVSLAYKKAIRRLIKNFELIPNRAQ